MIPSQFEKLCNFYSCKFIFLQLKKNIYFFWGGEGGRIVWTFIQVTLMLTAHLIHIGWHFEEPPLKKRPDAKTVWCQSWIVFSKQVAFVLAMSFCCSVICSVCISVIVGYTESKSQIGSFLWIMNRGLASRGNKIDLTKWPIYENVTEVLGNLTIYGVSTVPETFEHILSLLR